MYDGRTNLGQQVVHEVQTHFANEVFKTIIPRNIRLSEAPSYGQSILSYAPGAMAPLPIRRWRRKCWSEPKKHNLCAQRRLCERQFKQKARAWGED